MMTKLLSFSHAAAKNRKYDILSALLSDKKLVQQGNVCGYDLTNYSLARPNW